MSSVLDELYGCILSQQRIFGSSTSISQERLALLGDILAENEKEKDGWVTRDPATRMQIGYEKRFTDVCDTLGQLLKYFLNNNRGPVWESSLLFCGVFPKKVEYHERVEQCDSPSSDVWNMDELGQIDHEYDGGDNTDLAKLPYAPFIFAAKNFSIALYPVECSSDSVQIYQDESGERFTIGELAKEIDFASVVSWSLTPNINVSKHVFVVINNLADTFIYKNNPEFRNTPNIDICHISNLRKYIESFSSDKSPEVSDLEMWYTNYFKRGNSQFSQDILSNIEE